MYVIVEAWMLSFMYILIEMNEWFHELSSILGITEEIQGNGISPLNFVYYIKFECFYVNYKYNYVHIYRYVCQFVCVLIYRCK